MLKPDRYLCSQKIQLKQNPPVYPSNVSDIMVNNIPKNKV